MSRILIDEGRCKGCALCTHVCPHNLVRLASHFNAKGYQPAEFVDPEGACTACANCATMCPDLAITVYRTSSDSTSAKSATLAGVLAQPKKEAL
jgi:2-oxoglutarate ferredoxin oxidoreductase subunit delta